MTNTCTGNKYIYFFICYIKDNFILFLILMLVAMGVVIRLVYKYAGYNEFEYKRFGAVVSNGHCCAQIGGNILKSGGSAADAAIATMLCEGVVLPHSMGIGGGFIAVIYSRESGQIESLIAREAAPKAATRDMFVNKEITGAISTGVPSELYGYWCLHSKYGKLPWRDLFLPAIDACRNGVTVSKYLARVLQINDKQIKNEPSMAEIFVNPHTKDLYKEGEVMFRHTLANTLELVANQGPGVIYRGGSIGSLLVEDIQSMGGIITEEDLLNYDVRWEKPLVAHFENGYQLFTSPLPSSGAILTFMLNVMQPLYTKNENIFWHRLIETFKHAYGCRTLLGDIYYEPQVRTTYKKLVDPDFAAEIRKKIKDDITFTDQKYYGADFEGFQDNGTAHLSILAPNGDAISVTSTINSHLGAKVRSRRTGIILNDEMDDFSTPGASNKYNIPASQANYIKPGKLPMSSTCPSIIVDKKGDVKLMIGGAGGSRITTSVAQAILRYLFMGCTLEKSINCGRLHHQLDPMQVDVENDVSPNITKHLESIGHTINYLPGDKSFSALTAIGYMGDVPHPVCDQRRAGSTVIVDKNIISQ